MTYPNRVMSNCQKIVDLIREHKEIRMGKLCALASVSVPTMYNRWVIIKDMFDDITYDGGFFRSNQK